MKKFTWRTLLFATAFLAAAGGSLLAGCSGKNETVNEDIGGIKDIPVNSADNSTGGYIQTERDKERIADKSMGHFSIMPPADKLFEMVENPDQWEETLALIDAMGTSSGHFTHYYTDDEMKKIFAFMNERGIKLTVEGPAVKEWGKETEDGERMGGNTAEKVFNSQLPAWKRIRENGGIIDSMAFDEPLLNVLLFPIDAGNEYKDIKPFEKASQYPAEVYEALFSYAARETAKFIKLVREEIPGIKLGDIEVHWGVFEAEDMIYWVKILNEECDKIGTPRPDFFRLDVNWAVYEIHHKDRFIGWNEIKKIEDYCKSVNMPFSLVYWSSDIHFRPNGAKYQGNQNSKWNEYPGGWYDSIMQQGEDCKKAGLDPDQILVETWITDKEGAWIPYETIPETKENTFTKSVIDLYKTYLR